MWMLNNIGVDWRDRNLIAKLYLGQKAFIRIKMNYPVVVRLGNKYDKSVLYLRYCLTSTSSMS